MEILENRLLEAATQGSISLLQQLLKDDPLILDRAVVNSFNETPLHVAAMLGHVDFVKEIINLKPQLINELNSQKSSPLHLASAEGHVDVVRALLSADQRTCLVHDRNELTPLHLAASKGRVEVMRVLLEAQPDAARLTVYGGESILHLCIKHYQLEALKLLVEAVRESHELVNSKDVDGNTVLHLAVGDKQVEDLVFYIYNTMGFISSLSIIFLLMSGLPVKNRFFMWILMVITWIAISATALTYNAAVRAITPKGSSSTEDMIRYSLFTWIGLTLVILIAHVIRLLVKLIKTLLKALVKLVKLPWKCCTAACSPV